jgi:hypothetical protein
MKAKHLLVAAVVVILLALALTRPAFGCVVWAPMWDFSDGSIDFFVKADTSGAVGAGLLNGDDRDGASVSIWDSSGLPLGQATVPEGASGEVTTASVPGQLYRVLVKSNLHCRPFFKGVEWARLPDDGDDLEGLGENRGIESDVEPGFDSRWSDVPDQFVPIPPGSSL